MSIPTPFNPMGTLGGDTFINEHLIPDTHDPNVIIENEYTQALTLADSLGFKLSSEVVCYGDIGSWAHLMTLGGSGATGWFGIEQSGSEQGRFIYSNNSTTGWSTVNLPIGVPLSLTLDKNGLSVNGSQYGQVADTALNNVNIALRFSSRIAIKSLVFTAEGRKIIDIHAAMVNGQKCLFDTVSETIINAS